MECFIKTQQRNGTNCEFEYVTTSNFFVLNSLVKSHLNVYVRNDSETHETVLMDCTTG